MKHLAHWDDVEPYRREVGHLAGDWYDLGTAAGSFDVGLKRIEVDAGKWSTPAGSEGAEEEIFFVLGGSGISWQDGESYEVGPNDVLVHLPEEQTHTLLQRGSVVSPPAGTGVAHSFRAGDDGLAYLVYGTRVASDVVSYPRAEEVRLRGVGVTIPAKRI
jgi:uncharacterized cupin superfamily protein